MKHIYTFLCLLLIGGVAVADVTGIAHVTDGDTVKIGDTRVRLHGIDAPEQQQECGKNGQAWRCGHASTQTLSNLIDGQVVTCKGTDTDQYERLIAVCYVNGIDLNAAMVDAGMAMAYRRYSKNYVPNELRAKEKGKGLWVDNFVYPWDWRQGKRVADGHAYVVSAEYGDGTYTGEIFTGLPHGEGAWTFTDSRRFIGEFKKGDFHGYMDATFSDGSSYVGYYYRGLRHGYGTDTKIDGSTYVGEFSGDKRHGKGTRTYADGSKFVGEYKNGKRWAGTEYDGDGKVTATFQEGVRME